MWKYWNVRYDPRPQADKDLGLDIVLKTHKTGLDELDATNEFGEILDIMSWAEVAFNLAGRAMISWDPSAHLRCRLRLADAFPA